MDETELAPESAFPGRAQFGRWKKKLRRSLGKALNGQAGLLCMLALFCATPYAASVDWSGVVTDLVMGRNSSYPADPALLAEAKALGLDYEAVARNPSGYEEKPVLWCLGKDGIGRVVVSGNTGWHVSIEAPGLAGPDGHHTAVCRKTLAVVEPSKDAGVNLRFAGFP